MRLTILLLLLSFIIYTNSFISGTTKLLKNPIFLQINKLLKKTNLTTECTSDLNALKQDIWKLKPWALNMFDSSGKPGAGLLEGNIHFIGNYDQCLSIKENVTNRIIQGQYCTALVIIDKEIAGSHIETLQNILDRHKNTDLPDPLNLLLQGIPVTLGLCVPKSCSVQDLTSITRTIETLLRLPAKIHFRESFCQYESKPKNFKNFDFIVYFFSAIILVTVITSTLYDLHLQQSEQKPNIYVSFSVITNFKKLITLKALDPNCITCIYGIKVFCCLWVIWGHFSLYSIISTKNIIVVEEFKKQIVAAYSWSSFYGIDSFFTLSGLLTTYNYLNFSKKNSVNLYSFYVSRFIRLTPALLPITFIDASILKLFANGPFAEVTINLATEKCYSTWWQSFLYFIFLPHQQCAMHTWYVTIDSRFYLFAPLILFLIQKYPKTVLVGIISGVVVGITYSVLLTIEKEIGFTVFQYNLDYVDNLYMTNLHHMPSWLMGVLLGYILHLKKFKIAYGFNVLLLIIASYTMHLLMAKQIDYVNSDYNVYRAALWNGFSAPLWSLALSIVIYSCATGNGGFINKFLSHSIFQVLHKLTYSAYLFHSCLLIVLFANIKETTQFPGYPIFLEYIKILLIIFPFSILFHLIFEAPFMALKAYFYVEKPEEVTYEKNK